jgi:hypothetical protein
VSAALKERHFVDGYIGPRANIYQTHGNDKSEGARALAEWTEAGIREGHSLYYINFMFESLHGPRNAVLHQMRLAIHRGFYSPLCRLSAHHPKAPAERHRLPEAMLIPDLPTYKATGGALLYGNANGGCHYNGFIRIPASCRFKRPLEEYVIENVFRFRRQGIARINVQPANRTLEHLADYATKTVKRGLASLDDIYALPLSASEMRRDISLLTPHEKTIKDIESSTNCSRESAEELYRFPKSNITLAG